jgi:hypothetical protein
MCCVAPTHGHLVRSYGPVVDKPLIGGDWTGVLSSNDACGLSDYYIYNIVGFPLSVRLGI